MTASGLGGGAFVRGEEVVGDHDAGIQRSMAMDEAARMQAIERAQARIRDIQQQADETINTLEERRGARPTGRLLRGVAPRRGGDR